MSQVVIKLKSIQDQHVVRVIVDGIFIHDLHSGGRPLILLRDDLMQMFERLIDAMDIENTRIELD